MGTTIQFNRNLTQTDPVQQPVLIVGQLRHLRLITFDNVKCKLESRVSAETFEEAINKVRSSASDICPLYLDVATIAALPTKCSRYNTTSRSHFLTRLINGQTKGVTESIVIACDVNDLFASACAIVRAYPLYNRKLNQRGKESATIHIEFIVFENNAISEYQLTESDVKCLTNVATGIRLTAKIVDMPCSEMNVSSFLEQIQLVANELGTKVETIRGQELCDRGFGGIYGVGKAANDPPALAVMSYEPMGATENIVWVGKGIVYDTGGLSIKGKTSMPGMKRDCGGAAAILGAFYATVKGGFQQNLYAVFCLAENSVGPNATRPDDIHVMYSGRTVEINNTDAEGRLVLADGVAYAYKDLKANVILDMATLTGAQGIATGKYHAAVLTNNEDWETKCVQAGKITGDLVAPIVYAPELHFVEFSSSVADMKNSVNDRNNAQSSCAGLFIESHIAAGFDGAWIHIDMAAPVHSGERATGYGVALLCSLFGSETNCTLLQSISPSSNKTVLL